MYTLLSGLYKYMFQKDEYCILILGLDNAGKTVGPCSLTSSHSLPDLTPAPRLQVSSHQPPEDQATGRGVHGCMGVKG
ncbi:ADP-ribosylation factor related protein 1, isoform CRA_a [Mus musculus]|nr:ADP-ribosylation factor related protein 1, isoform CRA_a [Mus musculus]